MKDEHNTNFTLDPKNLPKLSPDERARLDAMSDGDIEQAALSDSDNPPLDENKLKKFESVPDIKAIRKHLSLTQKQFAETFHLPLNPLRTGNNHGISPIMLPRTFYVLLIIILLSSKKL